MKTLADLEKEYKKAPVMLSAIRRAIADHGGEAKALIVGGTPSHRKGSNCRKAAEYTGIREYDLYPGAKRQYESMGYHNVLVKLS